MRRHPLRRRDWTQVLLNLYVIGFLAWFMLIFTTPTYMALSLLKDHLIARGSCA